MNVIRLQHASGASAVIHEYGAQVTSWRTADGVERLFLSQRAEFTPGVAIRGGVPIIFPQFAGLGPYPKHGFARNINWSLQQQHHDAVTLTLSDSDMTRAVWPHRFKMEYEVRLLAHELRLKMSVYNCDAHAWTFTGALHTYLRVHEIAQVDIAGLQGLRYRDSVTGGEHSEVASRLKIQGEMDRIYLSATQPIVISEPGQATLNCLTEGFTDAVVWNPGAEKSAALADMESEGYRRMLCIEAAAIEPAIHLAPDAQWQGVQCLRVEQP